MSVCYPSTINWGAHPIPADASAAVLEQYRLAEMLAWTTLQSLTGFRLGICPITVRPCRKSCRAGSYYVAPGSTFTPAIVNDGQWINLWCGCHTDCACSGVDEVILPGGVGRIDSVVLDGVVVPPSAYRVDNNNALVRQDGGEWPICQDMNLPAGEVGTFTVSYYQGVAPDETVDFVAGILAYEYFLGMDGDKHCRLPSNVTAVTRQGVTYEMQASLFQDGITGINEVDAVIARFNPYLLKSPTVIMSVDTMSPRRTTLGR